MPEQCSNHTTKPANAHPPKILHEGDVTSGSSLKTHTINTPYPATAPYIVGSNDEDIILVDAAASLPGVDAWGEPEWAANPNAGVFLLLPETAVKQVAIMQTGSFYPLTCIASLPEIPFTGIIALSETVTINGVATAVEAFWLPCRLTQVDMRMTADDRWGMVAPVDGLRDSYRNGYAGGGSGNSNPANEFERRQNISLALLSVEQYKSLTQLNNADSLHSHAPTSAGSAAAMTDLATLVAALQAAGYLTA